MIIDDTKTVLTTRTLEQVAPGSPSVVNQASADQDRARYRPQKYCAVCGDKAIACNFNAVTCESCKAFFRRNAFKEQRLKCLFNNRCDIDRVTRRFCSKCRLLKCFQIGMKREWILTDEQKQIKRVKILQNKQFRMQADACEQRSTSDGSQQQQTVAQACQLQSATQEAHELRPNDRLGSQQVVRPQVETRDAATSTSTDEFELLLPGVHYCSLAYHCQYCSIRIASGNQPIMMDTAAAVAYSQHQAAAVAAAAVRTLPAHGQPMNAFEHPQLTDHHLRAQQHQSAASCYYELEVSVANNHQVQPQQHDHSHQHFASHQTNLTTPGSQISSVALDSQQIAMPLGPKC